jgi:hypothetical protein
MVTRRVSHEDTMMKESAGATETPTLHMIAWLRPSPYPPGKMPFL